MGYMEVIDDMKKIEHMDVYPCPCPPRCPCLVLVYTFESVNGTRLYDRTDAEPQAECEKTQPLYWFEFTCSVLV